MRRLAIFLFTLFVGFGPVPAHAGDNIARGLGLKAVNGLTTVTGGKNLIAEKTWDGSTTTFTWSGIPGTYKGGLELDLCGTMSGGAATMTFNGDTAAHYQLQTVGAVNTVFGAQTLTASNLSIIQSFAGDFDTVVRIQGYASGARKRQVYVTSANGAVSTGALTVYQAAGLWDNSTLSNAAVTSITVTFTVAPTSGVCQARLFGIN